MSLDGLGLPRLSRSYGSESSSAPSYSERSFSYQDSPTAPTRRQPTLDVPQEVENVPSTDEYCKACSAGTDPVRQASCKLLHDGEDQRVWIQAHGEKHCCGHQHRTLVLCFDGTGDQFDDSNSNVVNFVSMLRKDKNSRQLVYYQAGLGTYTDPRYHGRVSSKLSMVLDQMFAWNLESHVTDGYRFLMEHYTHGDKICIFGFSRGAYTARALAGMLQKVGLLPACNHTQVPFAYKMYKRHDDQGYVESAHFKMTFCRAVSVHFLGVWDTVSSVGLVPQYLPFTSENTGIRFLRHAIALDEHRVKFLPQFCVDGPRKSKKKVEEHVDEKATSESDTQSKSSKEKEKKPKKAAKRQFTTNVHEAKVNNLEASDVQEVWFSGVHCDVGGGAVNNNERQYLARIPLRWMLRECFNCNTGMVFNARMLQKVGLPVYQDPVSLEPVLAPLYAWHPNQARTFKEQPKRGASSKETKAPTTSFATWEDGINTLMDEVPNEYDEDMADIITAAHDQLQRKMMWKVMEYIPMYLKTNKAIKAGEKAGYKWRWNKGQGRKIPKDELETDRWQVHRTVKMRLEWDSEYQPLVRPNLKSEKTIVVEGKEKKVRVARQMGRSEWNVAESQHFDWVPRVLLQEPEKLSA